MNNRGYGVKEAFNILYPAFQADSFVDEAVPICNWLKASLHATHVNNRGPPVTVLNLVAPFADQDLSMHRTTLLLNALPDLPTSKDPGLNSAIIQMANAVATQANKAHTTCLAKEIEKEQPTLPSAKFSILFPTLKMLLNVAEEADLPKLWFALAAATKKQEFSVVREALDAFSRSPQAFLNIAPTPTPKLVSDLTMITFVSNHPDDLKTGLQPFVVMDGSEEYRSALQQIAQNYTLLSERDFGLHYADLA